MKFFHLSTICSSVTLISHSFFQSVSAKSNQNDFKLSFYVESIFNTHQGENQNLENHLNGTNCAQIVFKTISSCFRVRNRQKTTKKKEINAQSLYPRCRLQLHSTETQTNTKTRSLCVAKLPPRINIPPQPFVSPLRPSQEATALSSSRTPTQ